MSFKDSEESVRREIHPLEAIAWILLTTAICIVILLYVKVR